MSLSQLTVLRAQGKKRRAAASAGTFPAHVAWDMTHAGRIQTGIGGYARNLMPALENFCDVRISTLAAPRLFNGRTGFLARSSRAAHQVMWTQFGLRTELRRIKPDLLHAPAFVSTLVAPCPLVVTIHDVAYIHFPQHYEKPWLWYIRLLVPLAARRASAVIAVSEHAKQDIQRHLNLPPHKVHAVYQGVDGSRFRPLAPPETALVTQRYGLDTPFVLHVGNLAARKNIPTLLKAVFRLKKANFWRNRRIVLVGGVSPGLPGYAEIRATIEKLGLEQEVVLLGHAPDDDLPAIYNLAEAVVMPTLYEGFGLPVLEAMACGRPVIASQCSSLPEVGGDAALLVDPMDSEAWAQALSQVLTDEALRQSMVERGLRRACAFTWEKTAEATLRVYGNVLAGGSRSANSDVAPSEMGSIL
jgi:glycosyltransferase involved in cell wall biosynthesis